MSPFQDFGVRRRLALALIVLVAFFLRLLHVLTDATVPTSDMLVYTDMAANRMTLAGIFSSTRGWMRFPPGYPLFLKPFFLLPAESALLAARVGQCALGALTCLLVYRLARILHSRRAGMAAALITCLFAHFLFYCTFLMSETFFIAVYLWGLLLALRAAERPSTKALYSAGLVAAASVLTRPAGVSLLPALAYAFFRSGERRGGALRAMAITAAGGLTLIAPWALRNWYVYGHPVVIAPAQSVNLYIGNNPGATGRFQNAPETMSDRWEQGEWYRREALRFLRSDPAGALLITLRLKMDAFWEIASPWPLYSLDPMLFAGGASFLLVSWRIVLVAGTVGAGVILAARRRGAWVTPACMAAYLGVHLVYFAQPRFRLPIEALFLAWAGAACAGLARCWPRLRRTRDTGWGLACCLALILLLSQSAVSAAAVRVSLGRASSLLASAEGLVVDRAKGPVALLGETPLPLDRQRGHYLQVSLLALRSSKEDNPPRLGRVRLEFLDRAGKSVQWIDDALYTLEALPRDRWTHIVFRAHLPPQASSCRLTLTPLPGGGDRLEIRQPTLRYSTGNDAALEFLTPYLRMGE